jgi:hypothetical protein
VSNALYTKYLFLVSLFLILFYVFVVHIFIDTDHIPPCVYLFLYGIADDYLD